MFNRLSLGDIDGDATDRPAFPAAAASRADDVPQPDHSAVGSASLVLEVDRLTGRRPHHEPGHACQLVRVNEGISDGTGAHQSPRRITEDAFDAVVDERQLERLGVDLPDDGVDRLHQVVEPTLGDARPLGEVGGFAACVQGFDPTAAVMTRDIRPGLR